MQAKRTDRKNRILRNGESMRKDGRYAFKYTDAFGKTRFIYSWRLTATDPIPKGKRKDLSLREKEKKILKDLEDCIDSVSQDMTILELVERYVSQKRNVKYATQLSYKVLINFLRREKFATKKIGSIKKSDVKIWIIKIKEDGYAYNTIKNFLKVVKPAFDMAVEDDILRKNPFNFSLKDVLSDDTQKREALSIEDEKRFVEYLKEYDKTRRCHYYDDIIVLMNTGMRISELCGLTINDLDFNNGLISIDKQLIRQANNVFKLVPPKTKNSVRFIPMNNKTRIALQNIIENRRTPNFDEIDGHQDLLFIDYYGNPKMPAHYNFYLNCLLKAYAKSHDIPLPHITPHIFRHTYCSRLANKGVNPKTLQMLLGHAKIDTTLNVYTHASLDNVLSELKRVSVL